MAVSSPPSTGSRPIELPAAADRIATSIGDVRLPDRLATRVSVEHNCHTVQATVLQPERESTGDLLLDNQSYRLLQFHLHTPSEHVVQAGPGGTVNFPGELHFVHAAVSATGELDASRLAVLGVFIDVTDDRHNPVADRFFEALTGDYVRERTSGHEAGPISVDVGSLWAPAESFWRYRGSLTTPPCTESVDWILSADPLLLSRETYRLIQQSRLDVGFANTRPPFLPTSQHKLRFSGR